MTECLNTELQDLLPDFAADALDDVSAARVAAHIEVCRGCAGDLAVLRLVRQARPRVPVPDISRIVAALPPAPVHAAETMRSPVPAARAHGRQIVGGEHEQARHATVPPSMSTRRARGPVFGQSVFRLAATLGVIVAGGASVLVARHGITDVPSATTVAMTGGSDTTRPMAVTAPRDRAETVAVAAPAGRIGTVSVSYGDLGDYSEDELERMLDRLEQWDGTTSTEPLPGVPILPGSGGSTP